MLGSTHFVSVDENRIDAETYVVATMVRRPSEAEPFFFVEIYARYVDRFERRNGGPWLIAHRRVAMDHSRQSASHEPWVQEAHYVRGADHPNDVVHHWPNPA